MAQRKHNAGVRQQYTREFKLEAVRLATASDRTVSDVAQELQLRPDMLRAWIRRTRARPDQPAADLFPGQGKLPSADEELRRLRREVAQLKEEREILKKAAAFFARDVR
jgi:transposase